MKYFTLTEYHSTVIAMSRNSCMPLNFLSCSYVEMRPLLKLWRAMEMLEGSSLSTLAMELVSLWHSMCPLVWVVVTLTQPSHWPWPCVENCLGWRFGLHAFPWLFNVIMNINNMQCHVAEMFHLIIIINLGMPKIQVPRRLTAILSKALPCSQTIK
jgi:hypothetical protein